MRKVLRAALTSACHFAILCCAVSVVCAVDSKPAVSHSRAHAFSPLLHSSSMGTGRASSERWQSPNLRDPAAGAAGSQTPNALAATVNVGMNFDGIGQNAFGSSKDSLSPPDTSLSVGATQVVQAVNTSYAVFNKYTGDLLYGPVDIQSLFSSLGGTCATGSESSPIVLYDKIAGRWLISEVMSTTGFSDNAACIAISPTSDATVGPYSLYAFDFGANLNSYPKLGVWPDAYYFSANMYSGGTTFIGAQACALDRSTMLAGGANPAIICFQKTPAVASLLPSDLDGAALPPSGSPNYFMNLGKNAVNVWRFQVDFANPAKSGFKGPVSVPVKAFTSACGGGACISQSQTTQRLGSLGDRLMFRLAYRNFGGHESLVVTHSINNGIGGSALRWYEIRSPGSNHPVVYQQGTYAPDTSSRWMGSIAMDQVGDIAAGYSASSKILHPGVRFAVRVPTDPLGTSKPESSLIAGTGSQTAGSSSWGAYSQLSIDPADDCTLWYSNEYLQGNGILNWSTRVGSFALSTCSTVNPAIQITSVPPFGSSGFLQGHRIKRHVLRLRGWSSAVHSRLGLVVQALCG